VALLVAITVSSILMAAVLPLASAQAQRDREAELIFRGLQYAEGIRVFRRRFGRYPNTLAELLEVKPRSVRKLWKDPMNPDGEWGLISIEGTPMPGAGGGTGATGSFRPTPTPKPSPTPGPFDQAGGLGGVGPVMGVHSLSTKRGYRLWEGREPYNEWRFTELSLSGGGEDKQPGPGIGGIGGPSRGGGRGGGGTPQLPPGGGRR
jgi:type II secretory pathway pseudopilin PulG